MLRNLQKEVRSLANPERAKLLGRYFKTGRGEYAEGDIFLGGITTATSRVLAKKYQNLQLTDIKNYWSQNIMRNAGLGLRYWEFNLKNMMRVKKAKSTAFT